MMTIEKLDELREHANKMLEERRRAQAAIIPDSFILDAAKARYSVAKGAVESALVEWWAQGCKAPPVLAGGSCCYCKVPFLVGEVRIDADGEGTPCHEKCYREPAPQQPFVKPAMKAVKLLRDVANMGLKSGGEQYPNALCCLEDAAALERAVHGAPGSLEVEWAEAARSESERADKAEATLAAVVGRHSKLRDPPVNCAYCDLPITQDETMIGAGRGDGNAFAHDTCYWRKQADLRQEETEARVKEAVQHNDAYHGARYEEQAKTLQRTRDLIMERSNNIRECIVAIRGLLKVVGPAAEEAACHADLVSRQKCSRCTRIDRATKALARLPSSLLSEALKVEP